MAKLINPHPAANSILFNPIVLPISVLLCHRFCLHARNAHVPSTLNSRYSPGIPAVAHGGTTSNGGSPATTRVLIVRHYRNRSGPCAFTIFLRFLTLSLIIQSYSPKQHVCYIPPPQTYHLQRAHSHCCRLLPVSSSHQLYYASNMKFTGVHIVQIPIQWNRHFLCAFNNATMAKLFILSSFLFIQPQLVSIAVVCCRTVFVGLLVEWIRDPLFSPFLCHFLSVHHYLTKVVHFVFAWWTLLVPRDLVVWTCI